MVAEAMIKSLGYGVDVVEDGVEALAAVASHRYVAVLMDCQMPVVDGYTATAQIREIEAGGERLPIIAMTAGVTTEERELCLTAGMDSYLSKPIDLDALRERLAQWAHPPASPQ